LSRLSDLVKFAAGGTVTCDRCRSADAVIVTTSPPIQAVCEGCMTHVERFALDQQRRHQQKDW
jgi:hypothetical protein